MEAFTGNEMIFPEYNCEFFFLEIREMKKENQDRKKLSTLRRFSLDGDGNNRDGCPARHVISKLPPFAIYMIIYSYDTLLSCKWRENLFPVGRPERWFSVVPVQSERTKRRSAITVDNGENGRHPQA